MSFYAFYPPSSSGSSSNASVGTNGATAPTSSTEVAGINPTGNLSPLQTDASGSLLIVSATGAVHHVIVDSSALPSGAATSAKQDTSNTSLASIDTKLTSPLTVTGTVAVTGVATAANQATEIASLSSIDTKLTSQATAAKQDTGNTSIASIDTKTPALGQALAAASVPVVLTAAQVSTLTPLSSVTVTQATGTNLHTVVDSGSITVTQATGTNLHAVIDSGTVTLSGTPAISGTVTANQGTSNVTPWNENVAQINGVTPLMGNGTTGTGSLRVTLASDTSSNTNPLLVKQQGNATPTQSSVGSSATTVSLLAANAARRGATVFNDSTAVLYLKLGATASTTSYTVQLSSLSYYEVPFGYTGAIDGIWASANGNARITEIAV